MTIVGGGGRIGQEVALGLLKADEVTRIVLADVADDPGRLRVRLRKNGKVSLLRLDAREADHLAAELAGTRLIINCAAPFAQTVEPVARAAVAVGADYLDVCDDFAATALLLDPDLDQAARRAGVSLLTGMGSDPGTNNLLACWYAKKLDTVEAVSLFWAVDIGELAGAALTHATAMLAGQVPQYLASRLQYVAGGGGEEMVVFAEPLGACPVRYVGHPQPLTLPRHLPGLKSLTVKGAILPAWADQLLMAQKACGLLCPEPLEGQGASVRPLELAAALWRESARGKEPGPGVSGLRVVVTGREQGREVTYTADLVGAMGPGTGLPAAIAARLLLAGQVAARGVLAPEDALAPEAFLPLLLAHGARIRQTKSETVTLAAHDGEGWLA
ncbi:MAG: saccharopine dehydrogenase NADP-binding domain-containing protein [Deltaproteobacteria bacterium]|nr:saccharopine dehydrogenase NADP-binding domain-containing protein [Deltaproteobacteria bacterium]